MGEGSGGKAENSRKLPSDARESRALLAANALSFRVEYQRILIHSMCPRDPSVTFHRRAERVPVSHFSPIYQQASAGLLLVTRSRESVHAKKSHRRCTVWRAPPYAPLSAMPTAIHSSTSPRQRRRSSPESRNNKITLTPIRAPRCLGGGSWPYNRNRGGIVGVDCTKGLDVVRAGDARLNVFIGTMFAGAGWGGRGRGVLHSMGTRPLDLRAKTMGLRRLSCCNRRS